MIHDAVLHHFLLGTLSERQYIAEFVYNYGAWSESVARSLWQGRARSATDPRYFRYPLLRRIVEASSAVVVHNPAARQAVLQHVPGATVFEIPHLFEPPPLPPAYDVERLRRQLGCDGSTLLCGVFGHLRESKRLMSVLRAFAPRPSPRQRRSPGSRRVCVHRPGAHCRPASVGPRHRLSSGYLSDSDFWRFASAVDVCVNLRFPAAGESSGIAVRLMGIGKPVILTAGPETSGFPDAACLRVDAGLAEEDTLAAYLEWLARDRASRLRIGTARPNPHRRGTRPAPSAPPAYWQALTRVFASRLL